MRLAAHRVNGHGLCIALRMIAFAEKIFRRCWPNVAADLRTYRYDWQRPGLYVMLVYRFGRWRYGLRIPLIRRLCSLIYRLLFFAVKIATGIELPCEVPVGANFRIDHQNAIVISGYASFGDDCVVRQGVTVGLRDPDRPCAPQIGDRVSLGAGAKLLGEIRIGDDVEIGANAVVLTDVPAGSIAVGVPARILPNRKLQKYAAAMQGSRL